MGDFKRFQKPFVDVPVIDESTLKPTDAWAQWFFELAELVPEISIVRTTIDVASKATNTVTSEAFTVTALLNEDDNSIALGSNVVWTAEDHVIGIEADTAPGLGISNARITADNTITMDFINPTGGAVDPASTTYTITVLKG